MQKTRLWMSAIAVAALAAGCGGGTGERNSNNTAANGPDNRGTAATSGQADVNGGRTMTLRGCVQDGVPAGTYVLRTIAAAEGESGAKGTSGRSTAKGSGEADINGARSGRHAENAGLYHLIATGNLDLGQNLGKEVTITGEIAKQARDNTMTPTGPAGGRERPSAGGQGDAGTNLENGGSQGSGGGRVQGDVADQNNGATFFRVTSMNKVADSCR